MTTRRDFLQNSGGALAGLAFVGCDLLPMRARAQGRRREVVVNGKRVRTVDMHAHCAVPAASGADEPEARRDRRCGPTSM